jgi:dTDP-4-amino-4,6-dideoxygalactose transaminase
MATIPFNKSVTIGNETKYVTDVVTTGRFGVAGIYKKQCEAWLKDHYDAEDVIVTQSCTDALEMAAMLADVGPGDEVIMPSFTFSSTANAFALRGAALVFVDIDPMTLNIDPEEVAKAVTDKTKVIVPVDYAGHPCDMKALQQIADTHNLMIVEDAAQAMMANIDGRPVGVHADVSTLSFHNTKNIACGEGGALIINNPKYAKRAAILAEKGTNRKAFFLGEVDKYSWVDIGTSAVPSELTSAYLMGQLDHAEEITAKRRAAWQAYQKALAPLENTGLVKLPYVEPGCEHNAHMFYLLLRDNDLRNHMIKELRDRGISAPFHYVPLHSAEAGQKLGRAVGDMAVTDRISSTLIRLPMWVGVDEHVPQIVAEIENILLAA